MVQFNFFRRSINMKIVFYGPEMSGKTTSFECVHESYPKEQRSDIAVISTDQDRMLFSSVAPDAKINGIYTKLRLFTVAGKVTYASSNKLVLHGADGIVFVADSRKERQQDNIDSWRELRGNLQEHGVKIGDIPIVIQWNKRDLDDIQSVEDLEKQINNKNLPSFETVATEGKNVEECFEFLLAKCYEKSLAKIEGKNKKKNSEKNVEKKKKSTKTAKRETGISDSIIDRMHKGKVIKDCHIDMLDIRDKVFKKEIIFDNVTIGVLEGSGAHFQQKVCFNLVSVDELNLGGEYLSDIEKKLLRDEEVVPPCKFAEDFILQNVTIKRKADLDLAQFCKDVVLYNVQMPVDAARKAKSMEDFIFSFRAASFHGEFEMYGCHLMGLDIRESVFHHQTKIVKCAFHGEFICGIVAEKSGAVFKDVTRVKECSFHEKAQLQRVRFENTLEVVDNKFKEAVFWGEAYFYKQALFFRCKFDAKLHFPLSIFHDETHFSESEFCAGIELIKTKFCGKLFAGNSKIGKLDMERARLNEGADFTKSTFEETNFSYAVFSGATTFHSSIFTKNCCFYAAIFEPKVSFAKAEFQGKLSFSGMSVYDMVISWRQVRGKLQSVAQKNYVEAAEEYSLLKNVFERQNRYDDEDEAYLLYKKAMRKTLKISLLHPWQTLGRFLSFWALDLGCGYGTRPFRITVTSIFIALGFAALYGYFPHEFGYNGAQQGVFDWSNATYFSIATFTTMGFGDWAPNPDSIFRYVVTIEAFVGIFTMALFVGAFTRKVIR
ncbi:ion channel [Candidatus Uabimicrobium amorphum]|uniref:Cell polarity determinant GTPase MglA n=1 Tax=Uabimicrobium amorphum TaxID=2596890 RepID=A0A5S9IQ56_UABAM|nr:ion channel [Candidatus Uabimicrobium amorphum]BBM86038.1 cell polarity determinant GTPase MglA [Candidatus Uabimicrobium amorphum]